VLEYGERAGRFAESPIFIGPPVAVATTIGRSKFRTQMVLQML
jgi:hypothetical protein